MNLSPKQIVNELDKYIIGQDAAKRAAGNVIGSCALHAVPRHIVRTVRREGPLR